MNGDATLIRVCHRKRGSIWYCAATKEEQVVATCFSVKEPDLNRLLSRLPQATQVQVLTEPDQFQAKVLCALEEIFEGKDMGTYGFRIANSRLSGYAKEVLDCTRMVPCGYVTSYGAIAEAAGGSARSVGRVQASNPFPLMIPCHRVVRADLTVGGYGYGQQTKLEILTREKRGYEEPRSLKVDNKKLALFPVEWVKQKQGSF